MFESDWTVRDLKTSTLRVSPRNSYYALEIQITGSHLVIYILIYNTARDAQQSQELLKLEGRWEWNRTDWWGIQNSWR